MPPKRKASQAKVLKIASVLDYHRNKYTVKWKNGQITKESVENMNKHGGAVTLMWKKKLADMNKRLKNTESMRSGLVLNVKRLKRMVSDIQEASEYHKKRNERLSTQLHTGEKFENNVLKVQKYIPSTNTYHIELKNKRVYKINNSTSQTSSLTKQLTSYWSEQFDNQVKAKEVALEHLGKTIEHTETLLDQLKFFQAMQKP